MCTHLRITVAALLVVVGAGCSSDDDEPPSSSLLKAVTDALCESTESSIPIGGTVYSLSDCPP
jgi:hypothetical protein